jgi:Methyltransferase small domain
LAVQFEREDVLEIEVADDASGLTINLPDDHREVVDWAQRFLSDAGAQRLLSGRPPKLARLTFRGISTLWLPSSGVFPPTLDSYMLAAAALDRQGVCDAIWDVGCGTGVIGLSVAALKPCRRALFTDIDEEAVLHTHVNLVKVRDERRRQVDIRKERFPPDERIEARYDLLVCNPPYFPPGFLQEHRFSNSATESLALTRDLIHFGPLVARATLFTWSSTAEHELNHAFGIAVRDGIDVATVASRDMPLPWPVQRVDEAPGVFRAADGWLHHRVHVCQMSGE